MPAPAPDSPSPRERILAWLAGPSLRPLSKSELARHLGVHPSERAALRRALDDLEHEGVVECRKGSRYGPAGGKPDLARGRFEIGARGQALVQIAQGGRAVPPDENGRRRVAVAAGGRGTALPGDTVEVRLQRRRSDPANRYRGRAAWEPDPDVVWEARVTSIVEEGPRATTGTYRSKGKSGVVTTDGRRFPEVLAVAAADEGPVPQEGDLVVARITRWDHPQRPPQARITKVIGDPDAPGNDILALVHGYGLPDAFPAAVRHEAAAFPAAIDPHDARDREDWRDRLVVTIDPSDARDFDDAIHVEKTGSGWRLAVHIADVAHYVRPGSALDREACRRGNSVYLVDRVLPMLPEGLSNGLCSLVPGEDRLTRAVVMDFDASARLKSVRFASAVIRSRRRLSYEEAVAILRAPPGPATADPVAAMLDDAWRLGAKLRQRRFRHGALDLDFPEVKVELDPQGRAVGLRKIEHDISHQLIEEFMLAANEAVAVAVRQAGVPCLFRVHDEPDTEKLWQFRELARAYGLAGGDPTDRTELQHLLRKIRGRPEEHALKLALLKSLKRAAYAAAPRGHYGLALANYLHFTSPIRRYADLVAHRVLGRLAAHQPVCPCPVPSPPELVETAAHVSLTERIAADAEAESRQIKIVDYFERLLVGNDPQTFPAVVIEARRHGAFIELVDLQVRGLVPAALFPAGDWFYEGEQMRWRSLRPKSVVVAGTRLAVRIARVDRANGFLDFRCG